MNPKLSFYYNILTIRFISCIIYFPHLSILLTLGHNINICNSYPIITNICVISNLTFILLCFWNNNLTIMKMLEFLVVNLSMFLPIKVSQFIHIVAKKKFHDDVCFQLFWRQFLKSFLLSWWLYHNVNKFPFLKFCDFIVLLKFSFDGLMGFQLLIFSNSTIFKKNCVTMFLLPANAILLCKRSLFHIWWIMLISIYIRKGLNFMVDLNVDFVHSHYLVYIFILIV